MDKILKRDKLILFSHIGLKLNIYNGCVFKEVVVIPSMVGFCFGDYVFTKSMGKDIHKKKKKKKK